MAGPLSNIAAAGLQKVVEHPRPQLEKTAPSKFDVTINKQHDNHHVNKIESTSKISSTISSIIASLEKGSMKIDSILKTSLTRENMSNQELLAMQAGMYKYTQELDLCSKVVDKAVNGLKDVLKTQV
jgi:hypothetical protein